MSIFNYESHEAIGTVESVDTGTIVIKVEDENKLRHLQVNHLVVIRSSRVGQHLVGIVVKIMRKALVVDSQEEITEPYYPAENIVKVLLIGTHLDKQGNRYNVFKRTLETVPEISAECFVLVGDRLTAFMRAISALSTDTQNPLSLGYYALDEDAEAWLDGNRFFQRHAVIVGSTGTGKSWTVARVLEQVAGLTSANVIVFDIHGEYLPLTAKGFTHLRIAGPGDNPSSEEVLFLPYWLLSYDESLAMILDRSDSNAPNQAMAFSRAVINAKHDTIAGRPNSEQLLENFTIDSPIPYELSSVIEELWNLNTEMVPGSGKREKQGPLHGKLTRFIQRLEAKRQDRRLNFLFNSSSSLRDYEWMVSLCEKLLLPSSSNEGQGIKVVDFSEVPSDILPLISSLIARIVFSIQQWTETEHRHPVAIICDEAHLYIPAKPDKAQESAALQTFERIAKEGRKYGVGLVVVSQRPSEVNHTVLSQASNFISMRLSNADDQYVVRRLLPDSLGDFANILPVLDVGEAVVVGDASLLPSRIRVTEPSQKPSSATVDFWDEWSKDTVENRIQEAIEGLRKQSR